MQKILLVRMDKIGDLVLSLPSDQLPALQNSRVTWLVSQGCGFVVRNSQPKREFIESPKSFGLRSFFRLVKTLKTLSPDVAVVLHAPWWLGMALWKAGVPRRYGRRSQWHSWLFLNEGLRQSRKLGDRHEADLNAELVQRAFNDETSLKKLPSLLMAAPAMAVEQWDLKPKDYIVVHPGMAGSALNWPLSRWEELVRNLCSSIQVVITGTAADRTYVEPLRKILDKTKNITWLNEKLDTGELLAVLAGARGLIAPSTGVLHLSASLGTPSVGIYSPIPVQRPTRWGPRGRKVAALVPEASPDEIKDNAAATMERIGVNDVLQSLLSLGVLS